MIVVNGGTDSQKKYALSLAYFVCSKFGISPEIDINIKRMGADTSYGYCCHLEDDEFEVDVKQTLRLRDFLITLAHELVHVKQYVMNEMPKKIGGVDYWDRPHEIEAHGRELGLFLQWCETENVKGRWTRI